MKGFMIKYALSSGIKAVRVQKGSNSEFVYTTGRYPIQLRVGRTFFEDREEAIAAAKKMAAKKVVSLEKQLKKMRKLSENPKWDGAD